MRYRFLENERIKGALLYITATALCVVILCLFLKLWRADLRVPFYYAADSLFNLLYTKGVIENGWYWQNPALGAPGGLHLYEFPSCDNQVTVIVWLISLFTHNAPLVLNLFY
jgi:hypothetical protein